MPVDDDTHSLHESDDDNSNLVDSAHISDLDDNYHDSEGHSSENKSVTVHRTGKLVSYENVDDSGSDDEEYTSDSQSLSSDASELRLKYAVEDTIDDSEPVPDYYKGDMSQPGSLAAVLVKHKPEEVVLPPAPKGRCSKELQRKIEKLHNDMVYRKRNLNVEISKRKDFRNPSIYEKLVEFLHINENGTNFPKSVFDPKGFPKEAYYDQLAKVQNELYAKKKDGKDSSGKDTTLKHSTSEPFLKKTSTSSFLTLPSDDIQRKSKWDIPPSTAPSLKPTQISAIGPLKKPRIDLE